MTVNLFPHPENSWHSYNEPTTEELHLVEANEFLPRLSKWTSISAVTLLTVFIAGAGLTTVLNYNVTVKVPASIRPKGELRVVQSAVGGTVQKINVRENQVVNQGDVIAYVDDSRLQTQKSQLENTIQQTQLQLSQFDGQLSELNNQILAQRTLINRTVLAAKAELAATERNYDDQQLKTTADLTQAEATWNLAKLQQERLQRENLLDTAVQEAEAALQLAQAQQDRLQSVVASGAISRNLFEEKQQQVKSAQARLAQAKANAQDLREEKAQALKIAQINLEKARTSINPSRAAVTVASERINQERASGEATLAALNRERETLLQQRLELQKQLIQARKELLQTETDLDQSVIRAPITGTVLQMNLRNPGQVLQTTQPIAQIAPLNAPLLIKTFIPARDIDKVQPGQKVQMQVSACPYPEYGTLHGTVRTIAPDALPVSNNTSEQTTQTTTQNSGYEAILEPKTTFLGRGKRQCHLKAGMEGRADIISRRETVLQFILRRARLLADF